MLKRKGEQEVGLTHKGKFTRDRETDSVVLHKKSSLPYKLVTNIWRDPKVQASIRTWGLCGKMCKPNQAGNIAFRAMGNDNQEGDLCDGGKKRNREGLILADLMHKPDMLNCDGESCLLVIKNSKTTGVTIGHTTALVAA
ncbi:hypothetical protein EDB85DRAFT_1890169 [Lactarius pseudohatsudake]|nr:hypothetical protein EDB85DRAFT_1890169 [Lactarius pseudohatsudake]